VDAHGAARYRIFQAWRHSRRLPRWIALAEGDNELPIDLENALALDTLIELTKERERVTLVELFPGPDHLCARGPEGRFVHELVLPFVRRSAAAEMSRTAVSHRTDINHNARRSFPPGSEWLFVKLYSGPVTADEILRDAVRPVVERALSAGTVDRWFFIRYGDPDWHLRLRFHGEAARLSDEVLPDLQSATAPLLDSGRLYRIQHDTYHREVERYGGPEGVALSERIFQIDSEAVLALSDLLAEDARGDLRWRIVLAGMDLLLHDLAFDLATKHQVICKTRDALSAEFRVDVELSRQLAAKFRPERSSLQILLSQPTSADAPMSAALEIMRCRSQRLQPVISELIACEKAGQLFTPLTELAPSYLHMHANRVLRSAHRAQELVLYDFLARFYQSQAAREGSALTALTPVPS